MCAWVRVLLTVSVPELMEEAEPPLADPLPRPALAPPTGLLLLSLICRGPRSGSSPARDQSLSSSFRSESVSEALDCSEFAPVAVETQPSVLEN